MAKFTFSITFNNSCVVKSNIAKWETGDKGNSLNIVYNAGTTQVIDKLRIKTNTDTKIDYSLSFELKEFSLKKEVYHPGHLCLKMELTNILKYGTTLDSTASDYATIDHTIEKDLPLFLKGARITLRKENEEIAKDYHICNLRLKKRFTTQKDTVKDTTTTIEVYDTIIDSYSPDYFLTLDKSSKAYTGKKLWDDVIMPYMPIKPVKTDKMSETDYESLLSEYDKIKGHLTSSFWPKYLMNQIDFKNSSTDTSKYKLRMNFNRLRYISTSDSREFEFIQPYLVQYDESVYDFIVRVLNRCGEYFYYERGAFVFGWIEPNLLSECLITDKHQIIEDEKLLVEGKEVLDDSGNPKLKEDGNRGESRRNIYSMENYKKDFIKAKNDTKDGKKTINVPTKINSYVSAETPSYLPDSSDVISLTHDYTKTYKEHEAQFTNNSSDDNTNNFSYRYNPNTVTSDENLFILPNKDEYIKSAVEYPWEQLFSAFMGCLNESNLGDMISSLALIEGMALVAQGEFFLAAKQGYENGVLNAGPYQDERKEDDTQRRAFTTGKSFCSEIENKCVFASTFYKKIANGIEDAEHRRIKIELGTNDYPLYLGSVIKFNDEEYIVVAIEDSYSLVGEGDSQKKVATFNIEALPLKAGEDNTVYPPMVNNNAFFKKCQGAQRAFVTVNTDPLRMNRLRVRFSWQSKDDDSSPWLRMTVPMAGDERGFNFIPDKNDEAIINFEDDNIEKPFIVGMVFNNKNKPDPGINNRGAASRSITSGNGHSIIFSDPKNGIDAIKSFSPGWGFLSSFIPMKYLGGPGAIKDKTGAVTDSNELFSTAVGGIELTDKIGFYSINMSTNRRAISIDSPFGKVDINAFTGINISAPLGNVTIEGKNVKIIARNNLSMESGTNMEPYMPGNTHTEHAKEMGITLGTTLLRRLMPVDMLLVRTIYEALLRPVGGRMLLKSHYHLCFEAGNTQVNPIANDDNYLDFRKIYTNLQEFILVLDTFTKSIDSPVADITNTFTEIDGLIAGVINKLNKQADMNEFNRQIKELKNNKKITLVTKSHEVNQKIGEINSKKDIIYRISQMDLKNDLKGKIQEVARSLNCSKQTLSIINTKMNEIISIIKTTEVEEPGQYLGFTNNKVKVISEDVDNNKKRDVVLKCLNDLYNDYIHAQPQLNQQNNLTNVSKIKEIDKLDKVVVNRWIDTIDDLCLKTKEPTKGEKAKNVVLSTWGLQGLTSESVRKQRHTGKILYASGDGSFTYALNEGRPEVFATNSQVMLTYIKELLKEV